MTNKYEVIYNYRIPGVIRQNLDDDDNDMSLYIPIDVENTSFQDFLAWNDAQEIPLDYISEIEEPELVDITDLLELLSNKLIGGWTIDTTDIHKNDIYIDSTGFIKVGSGDDIVELSTVDTDYRLWAGNASGSSAPFSVTKEGVINSTSGSIGTWLVGAQTLKSKDEVLVLDAENERITGGFASGLTGFLLDAKNGNVEVNNIVARGEIRSAVFSNGSVLGTAGTLGVFKSAGKLKSNVTSVASPTQFNVDIDDPDSGHTQLFAVGDIIRIKDGTKDNWFEVISATSETGFYRYACKLKSGSVSTFTAGIGVMDYGASGYGFITLSADGTAGSSPNLSMATHAGSPWSSTNTRLRIGNLNGFLAYTTNTYGIAIGEADKYLKYDPANGLRIKGILSVLGNSSFDGVVSIGQSGGIYQGSGTFASPYTGLKIWNDTTSGSIGRFATYDSGSPQVYIDTDGSFVAGAGNVLMDKDGLAIIGEEPPVMGVSGGTNPGGLTSKHSLHFNDEDNLNTIADIILSNGQTAKGLLMRSGYDDLPLDTFSKIRSQNSHGFVQYHQEVTEGDTADIYVTSDLPLTIDLGGGRLTGYVSDETSYLCNGRLTLESGVPIPTAEITGLSAQTLYFTPYKGNSISLYNGSYWNTHTFTEKSLSLSPCGRSEGYNNDPAAGSNIELTMTNTSGFLVGDTVYVTSSAGSEYTVITVVHVNTHITVSSLAKNHTVGGIVWGKLPYDIFIYDTGYKLELSAVAWTNKTTRATELVLQDGVYCQYENLTKRYLGTICTTEVGGTSEQSLSRAFVWNLYNQVSLFLWATPLGYANYTTGTWRPMNNVTTTGLTRVEFVVGLDGCMLDVINACMTYNSTSVYAALGIGLDSTTLCNGAQIYGGVASVAQSISTAFYKRYSPKGHHYLQSMQWSQAAGTTTWFINSTGSIGGMKGVLQG